VAYGAIIALLFAISNHLATPKVEASTLSKQELVAMAMADAASYGLNVNRFVAVIGCESNWDVNAVSPTGDYGLVQVNLKSHPDVSLSEAEDPLFALKWASEQWSEGHAREWVCYRQLYIKQAPTS